MGDVRPNNGEIAIFECQYDGAIPTAKAGHAVRTKSFCEHIRTLIILMIFVVKLILV